MVETIKRNGEILFLYDAEMCNPNGDPDNENKPRMDVPTSTNLVTDLRLKRYIRDYFEFQEGKSIYVTAPEGYVLSAGDRLKFWIWRKANPNEVVDNTVIKEIRDPKKNYLKNLKDIDILNEFIDCRMFGATIPIKAETGGSSIKFTGPIQFNWGKSLNEIEMVESSGITSHFSSTEGKQGTMGEDFRLYYSLLAFHGIISATRAKDTLLSNQDLNSLDTAMIKSIPLLATRSKLGQYPRFYLRVEYNQSNDFIGDLRKYVKLLNPKKLRTFNDVQLDFNPLIKVLEENDAMITNIYYWKDPSLSFDPSSASNSAKYVKL